MINSIVALGYGLVVFAILIGVGSVVLYSFAGTQGCASGYTWNGTAGNCYETVNASHTVDPSGAAYTNTNYVLTQIGQSGLAGWTPAIIAISVGMLFLGFFAVGKGRKGRY